MQVNSINAARPNGVYIGQPKAQTQAFGRKQNEPKLMKIAPAMAQEWLTRNTKNRLISPVRVQQMARDLLAGRWRGSYDPIAFYSDGSLANGQHRLEAIVASGVIVEMYVVEDCGPVGTVDWDKVRPRKFSDELAIGGAKSTVLTEAVCGLVYVWDAGQLKRLHDRGIRPTGAEKRAMLEKYPEIMDSVSYATSRKNTVMPGSATAFLHFLFSKKDPGLALWFMEALYTGESLTKEMAVFHLRNRMIEDRQSRAKMRSEDRIAMAIKAWNAHRKNLPVRLLRWSPEESVPEIA